MILKKKIWIQFLFYRNYEVYVISYNLFWDKLGHNRKKN